MKRHKKFTIIAGAERSGKTFFSNKMSDLYQKNGRQTIIYNRGLETDYPDCQIVNVIGFQETKKIIFNSHGKKAAKKYAQFPRLIFMEIEGERVLIKDINKYGRKLSINRMFNTREEDHLFHELYKNYGGGLLIIDDGKAIVRRGIPTRLGELVYRKNHTGKGKNRGTDIIMMFHGIDSINTEIWDYATDLIIFPTNSKPNFPRVNNPDLEHSLAKVWQKLDREKRQPDYFFDSYHVGLRNGYRVSKMKGIDTQKI
jgi:hypothetical protein